MGLKDIIKTPQEQSEEILEILKPEFVAQEGEEGYEQLKTKLENIGTEVADEIRDGLREQEIKKRFNALDIDGFFEGITSYFYYLKDNKKEISELISEQVFNEIEEQFRAIVGFAFYISEPDAQKRQEYVNNESEIHFYYAGDLNVLEFPKKRQILANTNIKTHKEFREYCEMMIRFENYLNKLLELEQKTKDILIFNRFLLDGKSPLLTNLVNNLRILEEKAFSPVRTAYNQLKQEIMGIYEYLMRTNSQRTNSKIGKLEESMITIENIMHYYELVKSLEEDAQNYASLSALEKRTIFRLGTNLDRVEDLDPQVRKTLTEYKILNETGELSEYGQKMYELVKERRKAVFALKI